MIPVFEPGDLIRLGEQSTYPGLSKLVANKATGIFVVREVWVDGIEYIKVRWPDGTWSGALYAVIFDKVNIDSCISNKVL